MENEIVHKEIDLIQACITRMANNSFLLKGWAITIIAVGLALTDKAQDQALISTVLLIPLFCFWFLDAFFLRTEKMYREMYKWVLQKRSEDDKTLLYDLDPRRFSDQVEPLWKVVKSLTLRWFYGIPTLITLGFIITRFVRSCLM